MTAPQARFAVLLGGAVGTALRLAVVALGDGAPWATLGANVTGAAGLGYLVAALGERGSSPAGVLLGTGVLGAYTTFSALAVELLAITEGAALPAVAYAVLSLGLGLGGAGLGLAAGGRRTRRGATA